MKQVFWFLCASIMPALIGGSLASVAAQTSSPTPDPFIVQLTSSPNGAFNSVVSDISANGRFVVFVSNGDMATEKTAEQKQLRRQSRDLSCYDYAQRRIFQITNTKNVPNPAAKSNANAKLQHRLQAQRQHRVQRRLRRLCRLIRVL